MKVSERVHISGPLVAYAEGFAAVLWRQGYTDLSIANQLRLVAHLSRWLAEREITPSQLTSNVVEEFSGDRRRTHTAFQSPRALVPLLQHLRSIGVVPTAPLPDLPSKQVLRAYHKHLEGERGLKPCRCKYYMTVASDLLANREGADLSAADVTEYVQVSVGRSDFPGRLTALRSVLRFLFLREETQLNLVYAVPSASHRRQTSLPKGLEKAEADAMLATCDRRTTIGRRDYAALLLMVRLGLRAGEVAALTLDDINWDTGVLVVHGKGGSCGRLPLPADVGEAIVSYLRRRPQATDTRSLLLRSRAPHRGGTAGMITTIASHALRMAGIPSGGAHRLRHTAATQMLRRGASLTEIAQVLRHRHIDTTAIYAKVDHNKLRSIAQPWPTGHVTNGDTLRELVQIWPGGMS